METKTVYEQAHHLYPISAGDYEVDLERAAFIKGGEYVASLQCAEMKEENERLKKKINAVIDAVDKSNDEKKQLQEEVERLKTENERQVKWLEPVGNWLRDNPHYVPSSIIKQFDKALSGKESKTDK